MRARSTRWMSRVRRRQLAKSELVRFSLSIFEERFKAEADKGKEALLKIAEAGNERFSQIEKNATESLHAIRTKVDHALGQAMQVVTPVERQALRELVRNYNQYAKYLQKIIDRMYEERNIFEQNYYSNNPKDSKPLLVTWIAEPM